MSPSSTTSAGGPKSQSLWQHKPRVLLACADRSFCSELTEVLIVTGFEVETTHDGISCCCCVSHHKPDILVIVNALPWGGTEGVLETLAELGPWLRCSTYYIGTENGLGSPSPQVFEKLSGIQIQSNPRTQDELSLLLREPTTRPFGGKKLSDVEAG